MKNPAIVIPDAMQVLQALSAAIEKGGIPPATLSLIHLRASQMNGCSTHGCSTRDWVKRQ